MKSIPRYFMLLLALLLAACIPIQPPAAPAAASAGGSAANAAAANTAGPVAELAGEFELVQLIVDFPLGTWTPSHTHGGMLLVTVRNGALTVRDDGDQETIYKAGEAFVETPGEYLEIGNDGTDVASVSTAALLPKGAKLTTVKEGISTDKVPPGPELKYKYVLAGNSK